MAGAEKIGEAFVELGGDLSPLKKSLDQAKSMTNAAVAGMGKVAGAVPIGAAGAAAGKVAGAAGIAGGLAGTLASITKGIMAVAELEDHVLTLTALWARLGKDSSVELDRLRNKVVELQAEFSGPLGISPISDQAAFGMARALRTAGISLEDFDKLARAAIGNADMLGISVEDSVQRMISVWKGAAAIDLFKIDVAPQLPANAQFLEAIAAGVDRFAVALKKLDTIGGKGRILKGAAAEGALGLGKMLSDFGQRLGLLRPSENVQLDIANAADAAAANVTGKTRAERRRRAGAVGVPGMGVLSDEEQAARLSHLFDRPIETRGNRSAAQLDRLIDIGEVQQEHAAESLVIQQREAEKTPQVISKD